MSFVYTVIAGIACTPSHCHFHPPMPRPGLEFECITMQYFAMQTTRIGRNNQRVDYVACYKKNARSPFPFSSTLHVAKGCTAGCKHRPCSKQYIVYVPSAFSRSSWVGLTEISQIPISAGGPFGVPENTVRRSCRWPHSRIHVPTDNPSV